MSNLIRTISLSLLLAVSTCAAQQAVIIELPDGKLFGIAYTPAGEQVILTSITIVKAPAPNPTKLATQYIVLRDPRQITTDQATVMLELMEKYPKGALPEMFILDVTDPATRVQQFLKLKNDKAPSAKFPYYFLVAKGGAVVDRGELLPTTEDNVKQVAKFQEKAAKEKK